MNLTPFLRGAGILAVLMGSAMGAAPQLQAIPNQATEDSTPLVLQLSVTDPDTPMSGLSFRAESNNPFVLPTSSFQFQGAGGHPQLRIAPRPGQPGPVEVKVTVDDGTDRAQVRFTLNISLPDGTTRRDVPRTPGFHRREFLDQGILRSYLINIPASYHPGQKSPVAVLCHGSGQTAHSFSTRNPRIVAEANAADYIVVFPEATISPQQQKTSWTTNPTIDTRAHSDVEFLANLVSSLKASLSIDSKRVYGAGFSAGGVLTHKVAIDHPGFYAAIAPVAASIGWFNTTLPPDPTRPAGDALLFPDHPTTGTPIMMVRGRQDTARPFEGGYNHNGTAVAPASASVDFWRTTNGCQGPVTQSSLPGGAGTIYTYNQCEDDLEVNLVDLTRMDHQWPDAADGFGFDASSAIFTFFDRFTRNLDAVPNSPVPDSPGHYELELNDQGLVRTYLLNLPDSYDPNSPAPLVFAFHGGGQTKGDFARKRGDLYAKCEAEGMILVFPEATPRQDGKPGWNNSEIDQRPVDDVRFIMTLLVALKTQLNIDSERLYGCGFSGGAKFLHFLVRQEPCLLAAGAAVASLISDVDENRDMIIPPRPQDPFPMMLVNGRRDTKKPWNGGMLGSIEVSSVAQLVEYYTRANSCTSRPQQQSTPNNQGTVSLFSGCAQNAEVVFVALDRMDHAWPDRDDNFDFDANVEVIEFFKRHTRRCGPETEDSPIPTAPGTYELHLNDQGLVRSFRLIIPPSYNDTEATALVVACHGGGQSAHLMSNTHPGLRRACEEHGMILVCPEGAYSPLHRDRSWSGNNRHGPHLVDDVVFLSRLLERLKEGLHLDCNRIYATGFSGGGGMIQFWASETTGLLAAIAPVSSRFGWRDIVTDELVSPSPAQEAIPTMIVHGPFDGKRPWEPGINNQGEVVFGITDVIDYWLAANDCDDQVSTITPGPETLPSPVEALALDGQPVVVSGSYYTRTHYTGCAPGTEVIVDAVALLDHRWPDDAGTSYDDSLPTRDPVSKTPSQTPMNYDAGRHVIDFFRRHARTDCPTSSQLNLSIGWTTNRNIRLQWQGTLQSSSDLINWQDLDPQPPQPWIFAPGRENRFFRSR